MGKLGIVKREDLGGQPSGVPGPGLVKGDGGDGESGRHLHGGEQRIHAAERRRGDRDADNGFHGAGGNRAGEMGGHAGGADEHLTARSFQRIHKFGGTFGGTVGGSCLLYTSDAADEL